MLKNSGLLLIAFLTSLNILASSGCNSALLAMPEKAKKQRKKRPVARTLVKTKPTFFSKQTAIRFI